MHVNARSLNHDPNHILDRDPKHLSKRDSSPCEHSLCLLERQLSDMKLWNQAKIVIYMYMPTGITNKEHEPRVKTYL